MASVPEAYLESVGQPNNVVVGTASELLESVRNAIPGLSGESVVRGSFGMGGRGGWHGARPMHTWGGMSHGGGGGMRR